MAQQNVRLADCSTEKEVMMQRCTISKPVCTFRRKDNGCVLEGRCLPCVEKCVTGPKGAETTICSRVLKSSGDYYCATYPKPEVLWGRSYGCPMGSQWHVEELTPQAARKRAGQQKQKHSDRSYASKNDRRGKFLRRSDD